MDPFESHPVGSCSLLNHHPGSDNLMWILTSTAKEASTYQTYLRTLTSQLLITSSRHKMSAYPRYPCLWAHIQICQVSLQRA